MEQIPSPSHEEEDEPDRGGKKRRRTVQACEECRDRKRKCDGIRPVCGSCSRRPGRCIWDDHRNTKGWSNNYVEGLRSRIRELESRLTTSSQDNRTTVTQQSESSVAAADDAPNTDSGANIGSAFTVDTSEFSGQVIHEVNPAASSDGFGSMTTPNLPLTASISPFSSPSAFNAPPMRSSKPKRQEPNPLVPIDRPSCRAKEDSVGVFSDDESIDAVGSDSFVEDLDAMGVFNSAEGATGRPRRPSGYFGPSSTVSLLGDAFSAIKQRAYRHGSSPSYSWDSDAADFRDDAFQTQGRAGRQHAVSQGRGDDNKSKATVSGLRYILPTRAEADALVDSYWTWVHSLYPFVHMPSFMKRYRSIWTSATEPEPCRPGDAQKNPTNYYDGMTEKLFHCMLNLVFAMGALFKPSIAFQDRESVSRTFFDRAKALVDLDELACGSTALVQVLLLMGQYLQSTDAASSCWNFVGLAIRVCQGVGLHHEPDCCRGKVCTSGHHSQLEREIRRRTWTCSVILDRVLSLVYGRPMMIHPAMTYNQLCLPEPVDDEYLTGPGQSPGQQPSDTISILECYIEAVRLQDIIGQLIAPINRVGFDNLPESKAGSGKKLRWFEKGDLDLKQVLEIERQLNEWHTKLPVHLQIQTYRNGQAASLKQDPHRLALLERQATVLETRFLHTRLTLLRPALSVLCQAPSEEEERTTEYDLITTSMSREVVIKAANMCLSATGALVDHMTTNMDPQANRLPAPWYSIFYIHSCAMVLLLGYLFTPLYITCMDKSSLTSSYNRCVAFLRAYRPISRSARRCSKVLTAIQQQVFHQNNGHMNGKGNGNRNTVAEWRSDFLPVEPTELQTLIPLSDQAQSLDMMIPTFPTGETPNLSNLGWIGDSNDMAWLSLVPFWGEPEQNMLT